MKKMFRNVLCLAVLCLIMAGCKKKEEVPAAISAPQPAVSQPTPQPAAPAQVVPVVIPEASETAPFATSKGVTITTTSGTGLPWALKQDEIKNDPAGQWASGATASSSYGDLKGEGGYSPFQATGAPNVDTESDNGAAWVSKTPDAGIEWLDLTFPKTVQATGLRIRESDGAGAIVKIDLYDEAGKLQPLWAGTDPTKGLNYFMLTFPKTAFLTNRVKITLATNLVAGWNEIDAVQLLGADK